MGTKKALFFDIDGTLYDYRHGVPESTKEGIKKAKENGHYVFICTGRPMGTVYNKEILGMNFHGIVAGCGTHVVFEDKEIFNRRMSDEEIKKVAETMDRYKMAPAYEGETCLYYEKEDEEQIKDEYVRFLLKEVPDRVKCLDEITEPALINKFCCSFRDRALGEKGTEELSKDYQIVKINEMQREFIPLGHNKATGMRRMCEYLGVAPEDAYAFGDSDNDLDMIRAAGVSVAMGNGCEKIKKMADYTTDRIENDGLYKALVHLHLI